MDVGRSVSEKVTARHLRRAAYLYVRQSTLRQVLENTESTQRQYGLRQRAVALGWPVEQVVVIDSDLGQSGVSAADREGFQRLVRDVGLGRAGVVMGLEVSRLARNCTDWHRLLEMCALTDTLILDEDGVYDPAHFNDRLVLGLKGTMSEAETHVLRARLRGGVLSKARRGELALPLPIGFVYDAAKRVVLDPDQQVQAAVRALFETFRRTGSASATVKAFRQQDLLFPRRTYQGDLLWVPLAHSRVLYTLHNPRYAGAFVYGRTRQRRSPDQGYIYEHLAREEWTTLMPNAHAGYITWDEFEGNQLRLRENAQAHGDDRRHSPPREGPALLQGLVVCGACGRRMTVRYESSRGELQPAYVCQRARVARGLPICQYVPGQRVDDAVSRLLLDTVTPLTVEMTLAVQQELQARVDEADRLRQQQVERARYEAELARRRFLHVDPANRLVAAELEGAWNDALRALTDAQEMYERQHRADAAGLQAEDRTRIMDVATDFPRLWQHPQTPDRERKRMVRLLIEDVTLIRTTESVTAQVRFRGGTSTTLTLPPVLRACERYHTDPQVVTLIDQLLDQHPDHEVAAILNAQGLVSGTGRPFQRRIVEQIRIHCHVRSRRSRLREHGMLTHHEVMRALGINGTTFKARLADGLIRAHRYAEKCCLYELPTRPGPAASSRPSRPAARRPSDTVALS
jgi:DNA invertase Pin-like site-specific DNA recombinase